MGDKCCISFSLFHKRKLPKDTSLINLLPILNSKVSLRCIQYAIVKLLCTYTHRHTTHSVTQSGRYDENSQMLTNAVTHISCLLFETAVCAHLLKCVSVSVYMCVCVCVCVCVVLSNSGVSSRQKCKEFEGENKANKEKLPFVRTYYNLASIYAASFYVFS